MIIVFFILYISIAGIIHLSLYIFIIVYVRKKTHEHIVIGVLDIETFEKNNFFIPFCLSLRIDNNMKTFYGLDCINDFIKYIDNSNIVIYIHNINFDGILLIDFFSTNGIIFDAMIIGTNIYYIKIKNIKFRCSYKLLPMSLNEISKLLNLDKKLPYPYKILSFDVIPSYVNINDFNSIEDYNNYILYIGNNMFDIEKYTKIYCERDVNITYMFITKYLECINKIGIKCISNSYSASSISIKTFFSIYNTYNISKNIDENIDKYLRDGYFGGRCEVFGNPEDGDIIHHFDFSGMYGQCMLEKFPIGDCVFVKSPKNIEKPGFYKIKWFNNNIELPILPMKSFDGKLMFYNGYGSGIYWYEEILLFIENGGIVLEYIDCYIFDDSNYVFESFINTFNKIRLLGGIYKNIGKLLINSFYGRLGMKNNKYTTKIILKEESEKHTYIKKIDINKISILSIKSKNSKTISNIIYASIITSKARIKLYKGFIDVIKSGGRLLYCDTDSIICTYNTINSGKKYGDIVFDDAIIDDAVFILPKTYAIKYNNKEIIKMKGFTNNKISFNEIKKSFYLNETIFINETKITRSTFILKKIEYNKKTDLSLYKKRIFDSKKKKTFSVFNINEINID